MSLAPRSPSSPTAHNGFTLVELLVTASLLAVMALLAVAISGKMNSTKKRTRDVANLRTIGQTLHAYLADHNFVFPVCVTPSPTRTFAQYLGYIADVKDWSDNTFRNGADEASIRKLFTSGYDQRPNPDPLNSFASNEYVGANPTNSDAAENVVRFMEVQQPWRKIYYIPTHFRREYAARFSGAASNSPFIDGNNTQYKGPFPALFLDGRVDMVEADPVRVGKTGQQLRIQMIYPKR